MIETILLVALGFFSAAFLAVLVFPAFWRRAEYLTRKRIEASMPLSANELEAEKDGLRAEHAMATRRLEMQLDAARKKAAAQQVELGQLSEEAKRLADECAAQDVMLAKLEAETETQRKDLALRSEEIDALAGKLVDVSNELAARADMVAKLERLHEEASLAASSRHIELIARETDVEKLQDEIGALRERRKNAVRDMQAAVTMRKEAETALQAEKKRAASLEKKLEKMMTALSDREDRLERSENEIMRLKNSRRETTAPEGATEARLAASEADRRRLEAVLAEKSGQLAGLLAQAGGNDSEQTTLQSRLTALMRENKKLRERVEQEQAAPQDDDALREQIGNLAAEMVTLTATLEGPDSPINAALADAAAGGHVNGRPVSLAERVRALREARPGRRD